MENILYNELTRRGFSVDVGVVTIDSYMANGKSASTKLISSSIRVQENIHPVSIFLGSSEKRTGIAALRHCRDFQKNRCYGGNEKLWQDEEGILHIGIIPFLLDSNILER